jgi:competence protein ComEC
VVLSWKRVTSPLLLLFAAAAPLAGQQPASLTIKFFDVGQADAILITCPDSQHHLLIDSGDTRYPGSSEAFKTDMEAEFNGKPKALTAVVASHPHADHIGSMKWVLENFQVGTYVDNGQKFDSAMYGALKKLRDQLKGKKKLNYVNGKENSFEKIDFCPEVEVEIFEPWAKRELSDTNDRSVGVRLTCKAKTFLFVGDMEKPAEKVMLNDFSESERAELRANVLKVGHHGSDTSSSDAFIHHVTPELAVVSCGEKEVGTNHRYKHPRLSTVREYFDWFEEKPPPASVTQPKHDRIWTYDKENEKWRQQSRPAGMWITPKDGTITLSWDGQRLDVQTKP